MASSAGIVTGTPVSPSNGYFTGSVTVTDSSSPPQVVPVSLSIQVFPQPLTIVSSALPLGIEGVAYSQPIQVIGGVSPYSFALYLSSLSGTGLSLAPATGVVSGIPSSTGRISFRVQVTDQQGSTAYQTLTIPINPPLAISTSRALPFAVTGQAYSLQLATQAGTGGPNVTWSAAPNALPAGLTLDPTGLLHGMPTATGPFSFAIQANDGFSAAVLNATLTVYAPLVITTTTLPNGIVQQAYGPIPLTANGGSGSFTWSATGLPAGVGVTSAAVSGTPTAVGSFKSVSVTVTDSISGLTASQPYSLTISYPPLSIMTQTIDVAVGGSVSATLSVSGGHGPYTWMPVGALPQGFSLSTGGTLTGTATPAGVIGISVQVTDSQPVSLSTTIQVDVLGLTTASQLAAGTTVSTYSATFSATGGQPPYTFTASGLPAGLSLSPSGILTGLVKQSGTYGFTVQATDTAAVSTSANYSLTINVPSPLSVSAPSPPTGVVNAPYSSSLAAAASGGNPPYQWSLQGGALPPGIALSNTGVLSGAPTATGMYSFTVQATDGSGATASTAATLQINAAPLSITSQSPLTSGIVNVAYPQQILSATGGVSPYTFAITSGALPMGMSLANGVISGTPTVSGPFSVTITVTDHAGTTAMATFTGSISPPSVNIVLSSAALSFSLQTGATSLPSTQSVTVGSSAVNQPPLSFSIGVSSSAGWLSVSGGSATPAALTFGLTSQALSLAASTTPYTATVTVTCTSALCPAGTNSMPPVQTIAVSLSVTSPPAVLSVTTGLLSFSVTSSTAGPSSQPVLIQNSGGGSIGFSDIGCNASWCTVATSPASLSAGGSGTITITADPTGLAPGYYRTTLDIESSGGTASVPVTLLIAEASQVVLAPSGMQLEMPQGLAPGNPNGSFLVSAAGTSTINWTAAVLTGPDGTVPNWLILSSTGGTATGAAPGTVNFSIDPTAAAGLAAQAYYATIEVTAPGAINSPQDFQVVLNVVAGATSLTPNPAGLVFLATAGSAPAPQTVQIFSSPAAPYQALATASNNGTWLSVNPPGSTSPAPVAQSEVSVDTSSLAPGVYYGGVSYSGSNPGVVSTVNVTLIVEAPVAAPSLVSGSTHSNATTAACTPSALAPAPTGLVNNFSAPASWPTPLSILLLDDCGNAVPSGQIVVSFTNGDPPLALGLANSTSGLYSGTWTPRNTGSQVSLNARATATGFAAATVQLTGSVLPNVAPVLAPNGTLHAFSPQVGAALAPGTIVQIYGSGLASGIGSASSIPLPTSLNGTSVIIGGTPAPLYFVSPGQINAQIPFNLNPASQYQVIASANGALTTPVTIQLAPVTPGLAAYASGALIAQHASDGTLITATSPAQPGEYVVAYLAGMGATTVPVQTGVGSPSSPLAYAAVSPTLTLNGVTVPVAFAGLTPGLVGLYQIDFQIPPGTPGGTLTLVLTQDTFGSNTTTIPVQQ